MANSMQRTVVRRQVTYLAIIVALLTLSLFWRGKIPLPEALRDPERVTAMLNAQRTHDPAAVPPAKSSLHVIGDFLDSRTILKQSSRDALDLREVEQGEAELDAAFIRLLLTGSRGIAVTIMWDQAQNQQKRNEFHKLERTIGVITRLQPNFSVPWLFQSWNIAYNVSVENDRLTDMYYYIARGIELLAKGERLNRNSPEMRYYVGFYYMNKFSVSDKVTTLRSMMQVSCIPPPDRHPDKFRDPLTKRMEPQHREAFQQFVRDNPQLCRRLREKLGYTRPEQIVRFLDENSRVPTRYDHNRGELLPATEQFPALPPAFPEGPEELHADSPKSKFDDTFDAFLAARAWYAYSMTMLPPPDPEPRGYRRLTEKEKFRYRIPRAPEMILFRQQSNRAQTYYAERLQKEGWFDRGTLWYPDVRADSRDEFWFGDQSAGGPGEGLSTKASSREAWAGAYEMWRLHGELNGLRIDQPRLLELQRQAATVPETGTYVMLSQEQRAKLGVTEEGIIAREKLAVYARNSTNTNYKFFLHSTEAEKESETVKARALLWDAEQLRLTAANDSRAVRQYAEALSAWRQVLRAHPAFHYSDRPEEETYEAQLNLISMLEKSPEIQARSRATLAAVQALAPAASDAVSPFPFSEDLAREIAERESNVRVAMLDPDVQKRVNALLAQDADDAVLGKDWPEVVRAKKLAAMEAFAREKPQSSADERSKATDDPQWRAKGLSLLIDVSSKPELATVLPGLLSARDEIARHVVEVEFAWLPEFTSPSRDEEGRWVRSYVRQQVRERLNLVRRKPAPAEGNPVK